MLKGSRLREPDPADLLEWRPGKPENPHWGHIHDQSIGESGSYRHQVGLTDLCDVPLAPRETRIC